MTELDNKFRLDEARRKASREKAQKMDKYNDKESLYGEKEKNVTAKNKVGKFKNSITPMAVIKDAKNFATAPTEIQPSDIPIYGVAFMLAGLKDLLDLSFIGSFPVVGTVVTFCVSIAIGFILMFDGVSNSQRKMVRRLTRKYLVLMAGTIVEGILFGLNFLPFEMLTVGIIYWMSLADRKTN